jgi:hypothetical protein
MKTPVGVGEFGPTDVLQGKYWTMVCIEYPVRGHGIRKFVRLFTGKKILVVYCDDDQQHDSSSRTKSIGSCVQAINALCLGLQARDECAIGPRERLEQRERRDRPRAPYKG